MRREPPNNPFAPFLFEGEGRVREEEDLRGVRVGDMSD